jgi:hypothetical protein
MATFLITYHGCSGPPSSPEAAQQMQAAFQAWVSTVGDNMIDPGAPLGAAQAVTTAGVADPEGVGPAGYTLISADDLDAAIAMVKNHPFIGRGGTLVVSQAMTP